MFSHSRSVANHPIPAFISLQDLLDGGDGNWLSEYLSLSVTRVGENIIIGLTTTDSDPITYSTIISATVGIDLASLVFVAQHDRCST